MARGIILPTDFIFGRDTTESGTAKIIASLLLGLFLYIILTFGLVILWIVFGGVVLFLFFDGLKDIIVGTIHKVRRK